MTNSMIERTEYLEELKRWKDKDLIKVITGIRRCGKSTLFDQYISYLQESGIQKEQIIKINLEDPDYSFETYKELYDYINQKVNTDHHYYVFLDEVQNVLEFQKAVDGLYIKKNIDVYITGSNAYLLSGELATLLSGRYIEIKMLPLSFKEFVSANNNDDNIDRLFQKYISWGSFPYVLNFDNIDDVDKYIKGIYDSIILKDIMARRKFPDMLMLQSVVSFLLDNIGNITSTNKIKDTLVSNGRTISIHTVENYITSLLESFIFYKATRYDIKGKQYLKTGDKYYVADLGLRYFILGRKGNHTGHILENVVYLELLRRGYDVYIGKVDELEVDFVAINSKGIEYYQVSESVKDEKTLERELKSLDSIKDHNQKFLLVGDIEPEVSYNGIRKINVLDWLLDKK